MTQRIAILDGDVVKNIGVFPDDFVPDGVTQVVAIAATRKGDTYQGGMFIPGPAKVPHKEPTDDLWIALRELAQMVSPEASAAMESRNDTRHRNS